LAGIFTSEIDERYKLLALLKALQNEERRNRELYKIPLLSHPDQVMQYFIAYNEHLERAQELGIVNSNFVDSRKDRLNLMPTHRDNMSSLMAMVSELTTLAEESLKSREEEFNKLLEDNRFLRLQLEKHKSKSSAKKSDDK